MVDGVYNLHRRETSNRSAHQQSKVIDNLNSCYTSRLLILHYRDCAEYYCCEILCCVAMELRAPELAVVLVRQLRVFTIMALRISKH
jgi:hypothetical protein